MRDGKTAPRRATPAPRREFWEQWWVRVAVVAAVAMSLITVAVLSDPSHASWEAKTWELVHDLAAASVGRR